MTEETINACISHTDKEIKGFFREYRWLSNFHICNVVFEGVVYPSSENAYQAAKCPPDQRRWFERCSPKDAKHLGRRAKIDVAHWDKIKMPTMTVILMAKFTGNVGLMDKLLATGDRYLEETNWWGDTFWGVCNGKGENILGKQLMALRQTYRLFTVSPNALL